MSTSLRDLFESYKKWVSSNPMVAADLETSAKWISYCFAGRIHSSSVLTELVYSLSNLLVLFNDRIINESRRTVPLPSGSAIKIWLTVLEYAEVFIEVTARQIWGERGRWLVIAVIQLVKCVARLTLLFTHKEHIVQIPPVPPLQRKQLVAEDEEIHPTTVGFKLKSGRIIRSIHSSSPTHVRSWKPPVCTTTTPDGTIPDKPLDRNLLIAEALYIIKPVLHLAAVQRFGPKAWRPYFLSLGLDLLSLQIYRSERKNCSGKPLSERQKLELSRREVALLLYLLRSPFYDRYSKTRIKSMLEGLSNTLPLVGLILRPLAQYIPHWQDTYFYMWNV